MCAYKIPKWDWQVKFNSRLIPLNSEPRFSIIIIKKRFCGSKLVPHTGGVCWLTAAPRASPSFACVTCCWTHWHKQTHAELGCRKTSCPGGWRCPWLLRLSDLMFWVQDKFALGQSGASWQHRLQLWPLQLFLIYSHWFSCPAVKPMNTSGTGPQI